MGAGEEVDTLPSCFGLSLIGLQYSTDNQFIQRLKELQDTVAVEKIPLIPSTPEEMGEMLQLCSYVRFKVPQQVMPSQRHYALCQGLRRPIPASVGTLYSFVHSLSSIYTTPVAWAPVVNK